LSGSDFYLSFLDRWDDPDTPPFHAFFHRFSASPAFIRRFFSSVLISNRVEIGDSDWLDNYVSRLFTNETADPYRYADVILRHYLREDDHLSEEYVSYACRVLPFPLSIVACYAYSTFSNMSWDEYTFDFTPPLHLVVPQDFPKPSRFLMAYFHGYLRIQNIPPSFQVVTKLDLSHIPEKYHSFWGTVSETHVALRGGHFNDYILDN